jgi:UDP-N-acetylmuramyl pentapeptide phosphotransferase/UDP-N-acetylglucosamine-1-phosphate transferase
MRCGRRRQGRTAGLGGGGTPIFNELHKYKEVGTPRMGGIVVWASVAITVVLGSFLASFSLEILLPSSTS